MTEKINELVLKWKAEAEKADSTKRLMEIRAGILGKSGELTALLRGLKDLPKDERPAAGALVNAKREELEQYFDERQSALEAAELDRRLRDEKIDITIDKRTFAPGRLHPLNVIRRRAIGFFTAAGFIVTDSPEIETDYYNFDALNTPKDHPAREMQDTFFITEKILLRSQTSTGQIRTMEKLNPPLKMISPGRVYRADEVDATHSPCFHQLEGLVVDRNVTMCDLKGILSAFAKNFFSPSTKIRFRPSHFPFTEPSVEVDVSCAACGGKGCRVCKGTGYIEILGAGMVNRNVLSGVGIDPDEYSGFAFGMGLDRVTSIIHGITDARIPFEGDIRFLKQF